MKRLYLMRHAQAQPGDGQTDGDLFSTGDTPLSPQGQDQAQRMGQHLADANARITSVHASPAKRCQGTAKAIAKALPGDHAVHTHQDLLEIPYSEPGNTYETILGTIVDTTRALREDPNPQLPTGTRWQDATQRFQDRLETILDEHEHPLVVAHGAQNRAYLTTLLGMAPHRMFLLEQDHACLNVITFNQNERPALQKLNLTPTPLASQNASLQA